MSSPSPIFTTSTETRSRKNNEAPPTIISINKNNFSSNTSYPGVVSHVVAMPGGLSSADKIPGLTPTTRILEYLSSLTKFFSAFLKSPSVETLSLSSSKKGNINLNRTRLILSVVIAFLIVVILFLQIWNFSSSSPTSTLRGQHHIMYGNNYLHGKNKNDNLLLKTAKMNSKVGLVSYFSSVKTKKLQSQQPKNYDISWAQLFARYGFNFIFRGSGGLHHQSLFDDTPIESTTKFVHRLSWKNRIEYCNTFEKSSTEDERKKCDFILENSAGVAQEYKKTNELVESAEIKKKIQNDHPVYEKLLAIKKWLPYYEWVFWIDADALLMNFNISIGEDLIEKILKEEREKDGSARHINLIIGQDFNGLNAGVFMIRNCKWSFDFLDRVYNFYDGRDEVDNEMKEKHGETNSTDQEDSGWDLETEQATRLCNYTLLLKEQRSMACLLERDHWNFERTSQDSKNKRFLNEAQHLVDASHVAILSKHRQRLFNSYGQKNFVDHSVTTKPSKILEGIIPTWHLGMLSVVENLKIHLSPPPTQRKQNEEGIREKNTDYYAPSSPALQQFAYQNGDFLAHFPNCGAYPLCRWWFMIYFADYHRLNKIPLSTVPGKSTSETALSAEYFFESVDASHWSTGSIDENREKYKMKKIKLHAKIAEFVRDSKPPEVVYPEWYLRK